MERRLKSFGDSETATAIGRRNVSCWLTSVARRPEAFARQDAQTGEAQNQQKPG